jgi:hypothetical protein
MNRSIVLEYAREFRDAIRKSDMSRLRADYNACARDTKELVQTYVDYREDAVRAGLDDERRSRLVDERSVLHSLRVFGDDIMHGSQQRQLYDADAVEAWLLRLVDDYAFLDRYYDEHVKGTASSSAKASATTTHKATTITTKKASTTTARRVSTISAAKPTSSRAANARPASKPTSTSHSA